MGLGNENGHLRSDSVLTEPGFWPRKAFGGAEEAWEGAQEGKRRVEVLNRGSAAA